MGAERNMFGIWKFATSPRVQNDKYEAPCPLIDMVYCYCAATYGHMRVDREMLASVVSLGASPACDEHLIHSVVDRLDDR